MHKRSDDIQHISEVVVDVLKTELRPVLRSMLREMVAESAQRVGQTSDILLSRKEVAKRLAISVQTVNALFKSGQLAFVRIRRRVLVHASDLSLYLESQTGGTHG